ncbi:unnamed protein product [Lampetra fluviatilis]
MGSGRMMMIGGGGGGYYREMTPGSDGPGPLCRQEEEEACEWCCCGEFHRELWCRETGARGKTVVEHNKDCQRHRQKAMLSLSLLTT